MNKVLTNKDLLAYLKSLDFKGGLFDKLKVYYRPLVCPFVELISRVKEGQKVGDIGCGSGQFALLLAHFGNPSSIFGIEINDRLVKNANQLFEKYGRVQYLFKEFDGENFPDEIEDLDVIFLNDVLHHVPKNAQKDFLKNLTSKMKKGAILVLKDINGSSPFVYCNKMHDLLFAGEIGHELAAKTSQDWLIETNMTIVNSTKKRMYVYPHYTIIAEKK